MTLETLETPVPLKADAHGVIHVGGTRVTLDTLIAAYQEGATAEEIKDQYPSMSLADIYASLGHYLRHRVEMDAYLAKGKVERTRLQAEAEHRHGDWPELRRRSGERG